MWGFFGKLAIVAGVAGVGWCVHRSLRKLEGALESITVTADGITAVSDSIKAVSDRTPQLLDRMDGVAGSVIATAVAAQRLAHSTRHAVNTLNGPSRFVRFVQKVGRTFVCSCFAPAVREPQNSEASVVRSS